MKLLIGIAAVVCAVAAFRSESSVFISSVTAAFLFLMLFSVPMAISSPNRHFYIGFACLSLGVIVFAEYIPACNALAAELVTAMAPVSAGNSRWAAQSQFFEPLTAMGQPPLSGLDRATTEGLEDFALMFSLWHFARVVIAFSFGIIGGTLLAITGQHNSLRSKK